MSKTERIKITPYSDINEIISNISDDIKNVLGKNLVSLYLFGSLSYGDFNPDSSDIDIVAIVSKPLDHHELELIKQLHKKVGEHYQKWSDRLECSYTPMDMFKSIL